MHNLTGIYVKKEGVQKLEDIKFYSFSVTYPNKKRNYYSESEEEILTWICKIQDAIGYMNLTDIYQVKVR